MIALDTNVVVRLLVEDEADQGRRARQFVSQVTARGESLWLADVVLCETVWVLESCYQPAREAIAPVLARLVRARQVEVQSADEVAAALKDYASGNADFADALLYRSGRAAGCHQLATFDRRLLALPNTVEP